VHRFCDCIHPIGMLGLYMHLRWQRCVQCRVHVHPRLLDFDCLGAAVEAQILAQALGSGATTGSPRSPRTLGFAVHVSELRRQSVMYGQLPCYL